MGKTQRAGILPMESIKRVRWIVLLTLALISNTVLAREKKPKQRPPVTPPPANAIGGSLMAGLSLYSVDYEHNFQITPTFFMTGMAGFGYNEKFEICIFGPCGPAEQFRTLPHRVTVNFGRRKHFFEAGYGGTLFDNTGELTYVPYPMMAYRRLPAKRHGVEFRFVAQYTYRLKAINPILVPIGISLAWAF